MAGARLLAIQIDAAINSGNSGGPTMLDGKVVGVAFETLNDTDGIGYIIPVPVITHFLEDIQRNGKVTKTAARLGIFTQVIENRSMREYLKMLDDVHGLLITKVVPTGACKDVCQPGDVITSIDGIDIGDDGTFDFRSGERIFYTHLITSKFEGDTAKAILWRNGEKLEVILPVSCSKAGIVPITLYDDAPSYFIFGGIVFAPLTKPLLQSEYGKNWHRKAPVSLVELTLQAVKETANDQIVLLQQVLSHEVNFGYQNFFNTVITKCQGIKIRNLQQLVKVIENSKEEYIRCDIARSRVVIINRKNAITINQVTMDQNDVQYDRSKDLQLLKSEQKKAEQDKLADSVNKMQVNKKRSKDSSNQSDSVNEPAAKRSKPNEKQDPGASL